MQDDIDFSGEVSEVAKAAQETDKALGGPISLLLGPSFKLIGEHWGKKTEAWLSPKQVANLEETITKAEKTFDPQREVSPRQIGALIEWTHRARNVEPSSAPNLSLAWSKALDDILEANFSLLDKLANVEEGDINVLLNGGTLEVSQLDKLSELGLLRCNSVTNSYWGELFMLGLTAALFYAFFPPFDYFVEIISRAMMLDGFPSWFAIRNRSGEIFGAFLLFIHIVMSMTAIGSVKRKLTKKPSMKIELTASAQGLIRRLGIADDPKITLQRFRD